MKTTTATTRSSSWDSINLIPEFSEPHPKITKFSPSGNSGTLSSLGDIFKIRGISKFKNKTQNFTLLGGVISWTDRLMLRSWRDEMQLDCGDECLGYFPLESNEK